MKSLIGAFVFGVATLSSIVFAMPDVKHLKNLKIQANREYLPPIYDAKPNNINPVVYSTTTSTIESSTGYNYPKPKIPFPALSENSFDIIKTTKYIPPKQTYESAASNLDTTTVIKATTPKQLQRDYLPPAAFKPQKINQFNVVSTGAESRVVSTTAKPLTKDYLPPFSGSENRIDLNIIPSPKPVTKDYLPPLRIKPRPVTSTSSTSTTTTTTTTEIPETTPSYAPAANSPIPSIVPSRGPYYTKYDDENGYDYSRPGVGFDLPQNGIPVLTSSTTEETNYSSAPTNNVPVYTSSTSTTTDDPPAPEVIYTPSHTLDKDGYKYKIPNNPFNF